MPKKSPTSAANAAPPVLVCTPRRLPQAKLIEAAEHAVRINPVNHAPLHRMTRVMPEFAPDRMRIAVVTSKYWGRQGVHLSVGFFGNPSRGLQEKILWHLNAWDRRANARFSLFAGRVQNADVRIAFDGGPDGGYWSYLGTDIQLIERDAPTMNLEAFSEATPETEYRRVVCHEAGHTLGFPHEHMRRELVAKIDRDKAIRYFGERQGWSAREVEAQVLTPIEESSLLGTPNADPFSIMCYQIPGEITVDGTPIIGGTEIDHQDEDFAAQIYPKPVQADSADLLAKRVAGVSYVVRELRIGFTGTGKKPVRKPARARDARPGGRVRIFQKLQRAFTADGQNGENVRPEMVLGQAPLGYDRQSLDNFYDIFVNPGFGVNITTSLVGTDADVDTLLDQILAQGGE